MPFYIRVPSPIIPVHSITQTEEPKVIAIATFTKEREHLESMFELAINGEFKPEEYQPDLSVVIQQIFSYLYQFRSGVTQDKLFSLFNCFCSQDKIEKILTNLFQRNWILYSKERGG